jgi:hypothetical protein
MPGKPQSHEFASNPRAGITELELRELIDETAWLRARRRGREECTREDWSKAEAEVLARLGMQR